jgi:outer membrane protein assembly factor BamB
MIAAGALSDATQITGLSETSVPRRGYMEIYGIGFGSTPGSVLVDGVPAPFAKWSDTEIVAYVPGSIGKGTALLEVFDDQGVGSSLSFEVVDADPLGGRMLWRQRFDTLYTYAKPVVGPDGTIYVLDNRYRLYALAPSGAVKWVVDGSLSAQTGPGTAVLGNTSVDVAPDGTVYSAHKWHVSALDPDGSLLWRFDLTTQQRGYIAYDTKVGPDGNVYVAQCHTNTSGLGVYSLTPEGDLRWNVPHPYDRTTRSQIELVFGPGPQGLQTYFSANQNSYAISLEDGGVVFNNLLQVTGFAAVSPLDGTAHSSNYAYEPDGTIAWQSPIFLNGAMSMDSVGTHYSTTSLVTKRIVALDPDGSTRYATPLNLPSSTSPNVTTVTPDDRNLLHHDIFNRLLFLDASDGTEDWRIELPAEEVSAAYPQGFSQYWLRRPAFRAGGSVAYYLAATNTRGIVRERTYLYAVALTSQTAASTMRNAGSNPASYAASAPALGSTWTANVDLGLTGHTHAQVVGYGSPVNIVLKGGQVLLVGGPRIFQLPVKSGPVAEWSALVPNDPALVGLAIHSQAVHLFGVTPFALSNAQDLVAGY